MNKQSKYLAFIALFAGVLACTLPSNQSQFQPVPTANSGLVDVPVQAAPPATTSTVTVIHTKTPSISPPAGRVVYDVESSGTALEKRAPYGDSYKINRLERPFQQDMTYIPELDVVTYTVSQDADWFYISI